MLCRFFRKLGWFFRQERKHYYIGVAALVLVALVQLAPPKVIGIIIDEIAEKEISIETILFWIGILLAAALAQYIFRFVWRINIWGVLHAWKKAYVVNYSITSPKWIIFFYQKHRTGDLMAHATNDLNAIQNVAGAGILTFADSFISGGATIIAMILLSIGV